ncbi:lantibiotic dehydratase [Larkinella sp. C7]|jgi:thiopeptide-type bacteriocin biosynthesis protein|uniref:lantibiotic dehydratase n=1 Tax=Larkinella sp. C7 TaxID=2576607 RepID=UPI0011115CD6|nr:lantibiotic dehydratase [Larkinella sp. C7]
MKTTAFETAFVRVPLAGFAAIDNPDWAKLSQQLQNPAFLEALYIASPALYVEAIQFDFSRQPDEKSRRVLYSLIKYLSRYATRCTPFGLFGGFATTPIEATNSNIRIADTVSLKRVVRLDMNYLCALAQDLEKHPDVKPYLRFFPNSSLYEINDQYRYVTYRYDKGQRVHHLSSAEKSAYLAAVLEQSRAGVRAESLSTVLISDEISEDDARDFVESVIDAQLLVSELEPSLTGENFLVQILTILQTIGSQHPSDEIARIVALLQEVTVDLKTLESGEHETSIDLLSQVEHKLSHLSTPFDRKVLFQIDTYLPTLSGPLNRGLLNKLVAKIPTLLKLTPTSEGALDDFRNRFTEKYEGEEIPLVVALDPEIGIGFPADQEPFDDSPLVDGVTAGASAKARKTWTVAPEQAFLFRKVAEAQLHRTARIAITEEDLLAIEPARPNLPPTNAAMFSVIRENGREMLVLNSFGGTTGTSLLGRFGHTDPTILDLIQQISDAEDAIRPDVIFADIIHLPEARTGNIIIRPQLKNYQIPYLGKASVDAEHQIPVTDLMIRVVGNRVVLRSKSLNKVIVPQLSNAHHYAQTNSLDVYHFLCALQNQAIRPWLGLSMGPVNSVFVYIPRIVLDNIVLSEARWNCRAQQVKPLVTAFKKADWSRLKTEIDRWRDQYGIPRHICLLDYDNELYVDLENRWLAETFVNEIKSQDQFQIKEFLFRADNAVTHSLAGWHTNQFVVAFKNEPDVPRMDIPRMDVPRMVAKLSADKPKLDVSRKFFAGSEWLYYKIYTGIKTADAILTTVLHPLAERFTERGWTDQFFFIRYGDPQFHIRFRFHILNPVFLGTIIQELHDALAPYVATNVITAIKNDTYNRELERYGRNSIDAVENYFHRDSQTILNFLSLIEGAEGEECRWRFGMKLIDTMLDEIGFDLKQKLDFVDEKAAQFGQEFGYNSVLKKQLDTRFKEIETAIMELWAETNEDHRFFYDLNQQHRETLRPFIQTILQLKEQNQLEIPLTSLLGSLIHMTTNRLFRTRQRFVEYSLYYHLHKYYRTTYGRTVLAKKNTLVEAVF